MLEITPMTTASSSPAALQNSTATAKHNDASTEEDAASSTNNSIATSTANKRRQQHHSLRKGLLLSNFDKTMIVEKARFEPTGMIDEIPKIDITPSYPPVYSNVPSDANPTAVGTLDSSTGVDSTSAHHMHTNAIGSYEQQHHQPSIDTAPATASVTVPVQQPINQPVSQASISTMQQQHQPLPSSLQPTSHALTTSPSAPAFGGSTMLTHQSLPPLNMSSPYLHDSNSSSKRNRLTQVRSECGGAAVVARPQGNKKLGKKQSKSTLHGNASPAEVFHKNLVDAVSNVEDSDENEHYVYPYGAGNESTTSIGAALHRPLSTRSTPALLPQHHHQHNVSKKNSKNITTTTTNSSSSTSKGGFFSDFWLRQTFSNHHHTNNNNNENENAKDDTVDDLDDYNSSDYDYHPNRRPKLRSYVKDHHSTSYYQSQPPPYSNNYNSNSNKSSLLNLWRQTAASSKRHYPYYHSNNPSYLKRHQQHMHFGGYTSDEEEAPLMRISRRQQKKHYLNNKKKKSCQNRLFRKFVLPLFFFLLTTIITIIYIARPLTDITIDMGRVLATDKELIFDLKVQAENWNWWTIHVAEADISVFAFSKIVPSRIITALDHGEDGSTYMNETQVRGVDPAEYLGGLDHFDEPLSILSNHLYAPPEEAITQIRIKSPGADTSGNERWSRMIRYPYGLVVRGVLKYKPVPPFILGTYPQSVAICNVSQVDPTSGTVSTDPDKTICSTGPPNTNNDGAGEDENKRTILF